MPSPLPALPEWCVTEGLQDYAEAIEQMEQRVAAIHAKTADEKIWLVEHPPLYTAGTSAKAEDLLLPHRFPVYQTGRGGQYTYHGGGQRVVYVMLDLHQRMNQQPDLRRFIHALEEWIIQTLAEFSLQGERRQGRVGIWVVSSDGKTENKIAAIGIRIRKWVSYHGIAINVNPDLSHYQGIVPCGIHGYGVTSCAALGKNLSLQELDTALQFHQEKTLLPLLCR
jgi:lipoyl(octanoyl) transferase